MQKTKFIQGEWIDFEDQSVSDLIETLKSEVKKIPKPYRDSAIITADYGYGSDSKMYYVSYRRPFTPEEAKEEEEKERVTQERLRQYELRQLQELQKKYSNIKQS